jgi:hypothetical protein
MAKFHYHAGTITVFFDNAEVVQVNKNDSNFMLVKEAFQNGDNDDKVIRQLMNKKELASVYSGGKVTIVGNEVHYNGKAIHGMIVNRINEYLGEGLPVDSLIAFLENVMQNTSFNSRQEAFEFVERCNLPITEDGCFIGYKGVRRDFYDIYSGTILNSVGSVIKKDRAEVNDDVRQLCSYGLHVGSYGYATNYASGGIVMLVKVNPKNVVSVANDSNQEKIRVCEYEVVQVMETKLERPLYAQKDNCFSAINGAWSECDEDDWSSDDDDDYEDDEDDDDDLQDEELEQMGCGCGEKVCGTPMPAVPIAKNYHAVRDSNGRFTKKN